MYANYYGFRRNPFEITPDPRFFYPTPRHNEALASLVYGIQRRKGFVVVTGEVGTGKTLLAQCLFTYLKTTNVSFAYVFNTRLAVRDFLQYVMADLHLPMQSTKGEMLTEFSNFLVARYQEKSTVALIIDEAHLLDWDLLEEIRLLTNIETAEQKLLQVVLMGQPELDAKLESPSLRQVKQRIALRCRLEPLSDADVAQYIKRRVRLAGCTQTNIFSDEALAAICYYSKGIPRVINTLCENALIAGYARKSPVITAELIDEAANDFCLEYRNLVKPVAVAAGRNT
jgi:general secretion pathway protein A